ncbi:CmpA/NrtA family ABC transporter substrate-binding protein [Janthinobacterium fluminis]|uniref:CmpA/NrtA family ABC transporter substrate-binding protein n=1 Tax=Janthinobacterium fluminis TaxID=2987524 RepID=A0ABT5K1A0_9BURK|nr:CmpA/NrtA family ABC transporter substrate-binding protein [Janthinobacterium fluminis]MDC8758230.1 CmpA/NrtA family ABC transporter substrate-binding protein [Janthinobacterium fluminis]
MPEQASAGAWVAGSDKPERETVRVGFLPLTDCASLVMAAVLGFDRRYGIKIELRREASWAAVRDKLGSGELDAAHALYGLVYGVQMGIGGPQRDMAVLMNLNHNGQAITLSRALAGQGAVDGASLAGLMRARPRAYTFAQTFPTGTHAMYLYYWLAAHGIAPFRDARVVTVPPPQMVANLDAGHIDGFCAGEPWGHQAILDGVGVTAATTQQIWPDHPGKALGTRREFAAQNPHTCRALIAAVLDAGKWIEASVANKRRMVEVIAAADYLNTGRGAIEERILGHYQNGLGKRWDDANSLKFHREGAVNFPYLSDGMWFMTQHRRWGLLKDEPDYLGVAGAVNQVALYREAAVMTGTALPAGLMRSATLIDGKVWDGSDPAAYAASFDIQWAKHDREQA